MLWSFDSRTQPGMMWNDDWDGAPLQVGDYLLEGGENSWFYVIRLHRRYDSAGRVQVNPQIVMRVPGWDQQELTDLGDQDVSIENSVAFRNGVVYFANSGGLVQGWDISDVLNGGTHYERVFRFWNGDETDSSIVIDPQGYLYAARHRTENVASRPIARDEQVGDLMKLDPRKPNDPLVWSVQLGGLSPEQDCWTRLPGTTASCTRPGPKGASLRSTPRPARSCGRARFPGRPGRLPFRSTAS